MVYGALVPALEADTVCAKPESASVPSNRWENIGKYWNMLNIASISGEYESTNSSVRLTPGPGVFGIL